MRTHADVRAGERLDIAVEFVTRRPVECGGARVNRLLVTDSTGARFTVLLAPERGQLRDIEAGETYRISGLLGADPVEEAAATESDCPDCGGRLRAGQVVDTVGTAVARAAAEVDPDESFGIVDGSASVRREQDSEEPVDDWQPRAQQGSVDTPDYVCCSCGHHVDAGELRGRRDSKQVNAVAHDAGGAASQSPSAETVGLAAGGAKDANSFRENVANGYTPRPAAISDEGLFYEYRFETGAQVASDALFAPRYAAAASDHPLDGDTERYLSVGLDSTLSVAEFERPRLDLVVVLDVSGSMDSPFDAYYYDEHGQRHETEGDTATKMDAAAESLCALTGHLNENDRLGVVLFDRDAHVAKPLRDVGATDMPAVRRHIREITAGGGTNLAAGFDAAVDMLVGDPAPAPVERRVVFMTDMMPNTGATGEGGLAQRFGEAAVEGVHTTFVGMGLDANPELAEALSGIRGANHYFVHSASEFERRLGEEFEYMVTPLVYDLTLALQGDGCEVEAVHGSPTAEAATGRLMHVGTLFPSAKEDGEARGGVVLVRVAETGADAELELVASWTERNGGEHTERATVEIPDDPETFAHAGVRKAVALSRYARELRAWAADVHGRTDGTVGVDDPDRGRRGQHEHTSVPLTVPPAYAARFEDLRAHLEAEMEATGDETLQQESDLLETLCQEAPEAASEMRD